MKKTLAFLLAAVLCLGLIGCGAQPAPSTTEAPATTVAPTTAPTEAPTEAPTTADPMEGVTAAQIAAIIDTEVEIILRELSEGVKSATLNDDVTANVADATEDDGKSME